MKFVTLFPYSMGFNLRKDVGMIPYLLGEEFSYQASLVSYKNEEFYDKKGVESLNLEFMDKKYGEMTDVLLYLWRNYKNIDVLNCYHYTYKTLLYLSFFKILKGKKGISYLKLDADDKIMGHPKGFLKKLVYEWFFRKIDLITIETKLLYNYLKDKSPNLVYLPNGFYNFDKSERENIEKQKFFLTVSVLDEARKSTFTIIHAFSLFTFSHPDHTWKLRLVGPHGEEFKIHLEEFIKMNSHVENKIELLGPIYDPVKLEKQYREASIFILASLSESFGLVYVEALQYGCYILSTPLTPAIEITNNGEFGDFFEKKNSEELALKMAEVYNKDLKKTSIDAAKFAFENFYWVRIIEKLDKELRKLHN